MPVECLSCHQVQNTFWFHRPWRSQPMVWVFRLSMLMTAAASLYNLVNVFFLALLDSLFIGIARTQIDRFDEWANPAQRDMAVVAESVFFNIALVAMLAFLGVFVRTLFLLWRTYRAHPTVLGKVRNVALVQFAAEALSPLVLLLLYAGTQTYEVDLAPGFGLVTAPIVILLTFHRDVRQHFNAHRVVRSPQPSNDREGGRPGSGP